MNEVISILAPLRGLITPFLAYLLGRPGLQTKLRVEGQSQGLRFGVWGLGSITTEAIDGITLVI